MLAVVGELIEDIVVHVSDPLNIGSDTAAFIERRRGGSAANVAVAAAVGGHRARFIGRVGADPIGDILVGSMTGIDLVVQRQGRSGSIVVLVDPSGERTMLPDPGSSVELSDPEESWLDGVGVLHLPAYSLLREPIGGTCRTLAQWARARSIRVSIDASSVGLMAAVGREASIDTIAGVDPDVLLMNSAEADFVGGDVGRFDRAVVVVKRGAEPATVTWRDHRGAATTAQVAPTPIDQLGDSTGAGDAFAAGFLVAWAAGVAPDQAVAGGHRLARRILGGASRR